MQILTLTYVDENRQFYFCCASWVVWSYMWGQFLSSTLQSTEWFWKFLTGNIKMQGRINAHPCRVIQMSVLAQLFCGLSQIINK